MEGVPLTFLQNQEPKLRADDLTPVEWPADPQLVLSPPGHADLYERQLLEEELDATE